LHNLLRPLLQVFELLFQLCAAINLFTLFSKASVDSVCLFKASVTVLNLSSSAFCLAASVDIWPEK